MNTAAGIIIATGGITMVNEALSVPYVPGNTNVLKSINWRVIPATAVAAIIFSGIESVNGPAGRGLAAIALVTTLIVGVGKNPSPIANIASAMGYGSDTATTIPINLPPGIKVTNGNGGVETIP